MIELLQTIAGFFVMVAQGITNGVQAIVQLMPFASDVISYMPSFLLFPLGLVLSFACAKFVLSMF